MGSIRQQSTVNGSKKQVDAEVIAQRTYRFPLWTEG